MRIRISDEVVMVCGPSLRYIGLRLVYTLYGQIYIEQLVCLTKILETQSFLEVRSSNNKRAWVIKILRAETLKFLSPTVEPANLRKFEVRGSLYP